MPTLEEFVRDAVGTEMGMTMSYRKGLTFGRLNDNDEVPDPEFDDAMAADLLFFMRRLAPPPRALMGRNPADVAVGEALFGSVGCDRCHVPALAGPTGPVRAYTDMLLHAVLPEGAPGIEEFGAGVREFRTAPLWGLRSTAPHLHSGAADTVDQAIRAHAGEAAKARDAYLGLSESARSKLLLFLDTL